MDTKWFQDFLAVVEEGGFTRAAERRAVSQPAFSRRIKALEDWVGASLFDRTNSFGDFDRSWRAPVARRRGTPASIEDLADRRFERRPLPPDTLKLAATHVLSFTFFPIWLRSVEALAPLTGTVQLTSDIMVACEKLMIEGRAHFLLCHDHPAVPTRLTPDSFRSIEIGRDALGPVATPDLLEACEPDSPPYLAYTPNPNRAASWPPLGRQLDNIRPGAGLLFAFRERAHRDGPRRAWHVLVTTQPRHGRHRRRAFGTRRKRRC